MQGDFIKYFQDKINNLFPQTWQNTQIIHSGNPAVRKKIQVKLVKFIKIWRTFFDEQVLAQIEASINLPEAVSGLKN